MIVEVLIALGFVWLSILTRLVLDTIPGRRRRGKAWRWTASGLLLLIGTGIADEAGRYRGWSYNPLHWYTLAIGLAGLVILGVGIVIQRKERRKARQAEI